MGVEDERWGREERVKENNDEPNNPHNTLQSRMPNKPEVATRSRSQNLGSLRCAPPTLHHPETPSGLGGADLNPTADPRPAPHTQYTHHRAHYTTIL